MSSYKKNLYYRNLNRSASFVNIRLIKLEEKLVKIVIIIIKNYKKFLWKLEKFQAF